MEEELIYEVQVQDPNKTFKINVRIGDAQPGDHNVSGNCPRETPPTSDHPEWESILGTGNEIINKVLYVDSATQNSNPNTNWVSVRVKINGDPIKPKSGNSKMEVEKDAVTVGKSKPVDIKCENEQEDGRCVEEQAAGRGGGWCEGLVGHGG